MATLEAVSFLNAEEIPVIPEPADTFDDAAQYTPWVRRAQEGDVEALGEALTRVAPVARWAIRKEAGISDSDIEDLVQETALKVTRSLGSFDPDTNFPAWVTTIAKNSARDLVRVTTWASDTEEGGRVRRSLSTDPDDISSVMDYGIATGPSIPTPATTVENIMANQRVEQVLDMLTPEQKDALLHIKIHGMSNQEYAEQHGLNIAVVKSRLHRALVQLRFLTETGAIEYDRENGTLSAVASSEATYTQSEQSAATQAAVANNEAIAQYLSDAEQQQAHTRLVTAAIEQLPLRYRDIVRAIDIEGLSSKQYAELTGINRGTVRTALMRGRARAIKIMDEMRAAATAA